MQRACVCVRVSVCCMHVHVRGACSRVPEHHACGLARAALLGLREYCAGRCCACCKALGVVRAAKHMVQAALAACMVLGVSAGVQAHVH